MSVGEKRKLYLRLDQMLRMKIFGNAKDLAERLEVSRSTFFRCLDEIRMMGAPIEYDEHSNRYFYSKEGKFSFGFISSFDVLKINGGFYSNHSISKIKYQPVPFFETFDF